MASKAVSDREGSARSVLAAARTHGPTAAAKFQGLLASVLETGEAMPDVAHLVRLADRWLARAVDGMIAADLNHERELRDDPEKRAARDTASASLGALVASIRLALTRRFGEDFGAHAGVKGPTPTEAKALLHFARSLLDAVTGATIPASRPDDDDAVVTFDKAATVAKLEHRIQALSVALGDVATEEREAEATQLAKNRAIANDDFTFGVAASLFELVFSAAGEPELAKQVRPSRRRPGQTAASVGEAEPPLVSEPTTDGGGVPTE